MIIKNKQEELQYIQLCKKSVDILKQLGEMVREGTTPLQIDRKAGELCKQNKVHPAFKRVEGYNYGTCISVNDVAVHGIPSNIPLKKGDLVSIDFGIFSNGYYTDHCWTWCVGKANEESKRLLLSGRKAVENAISKAIVGNRTGDLGYEMEQQAAKDGYTTLSIFVGHGIGKVMHDYPEIPAFGERGKGDLLEDGMVLCIECQVVNDIDDIVEDSDGWSTRTINGGNSVMFEYMVIVRKNNPTVLTDTFNWSTEMI